jgi:signal transduction histidine kinase
VTDDTDKALKIIEEESKRLALMVGDILYLSRLETVGDLFAFENTDLTAVITAAAEKLRGLAISQGKEIILKEIPDAVVAQADGEKLLSAFLNLLGNCLRYAKHTVTLKAYKTDKKKLNIEISDDGSGFSEEDLKSLFARFYKGTLGQNGLGLAITKAVIDGHGGNIAALNKKEGGALYRITLPVV